MANLYTADQEAHDAAMRDRAEDERVTCRYVTVQVNTNDARGSYVVRRAYSYICPFPDVEVGDRVLVPFGDRDMLVRGKIADLDPPLSVKKFATKWVAAHVNERAHAMRMALGVPTITEGETT